MYVSFSRRDALKRIMVIEKRLHVLETAPRLRALRESLRAIKSYSGGMVEIKGLAEGGGGVIQVRRGSAEMKELEEQMTRELDVFNVEAEALQGELRRLKGMLFP